MRHTTENERARIEQSTDREQSPSGGHRLVYYIMGCEAPRCDRQTVTKTPPQETVYVCGNHTLEEFETIAEVKTRA